MFWECLTCSPADPVYSPEDAPLCPQCGYHMEPSDPGAEDCYEVEYDDDQDYGQFGGNMDMD